MGVDPAHDGLRGRTFGGAKGSSSKWTRLVFGVVGVSGMGGSQGDGGALGDRPGDRPGEEGKRGTGGMKGETWGW